MKKVLKILAVFVGICLATVAVVVASCALRWPPSYPDTPMPAIEASDDPVVIERGAYLFNSVAHCAACHSPMSDYLASGPESPAVPKGGHEWHMGPIGTLRSANITQDEKTGVGAWTDAELARAIRHGVRRDGTPALFMMSVGPSSDEDLTALISYMRTIPAVEHAVAPHEIGLLGKVLFQGPMGFFAEPHDYPIPPFVREGEVSVERGHYLAEGPGFCGGCHSDFKYDDTLVFEGQTCSGNLSNPFPDETEEGFVFYAPNLTPDSETGHITTWTKEQFMSRFRTGRVYRGSPMPWESYQGLTDADLESIWLYLRSLPPTSKKIGDLRRSAKEKAD
jgi:mono/diheme cytochrome c family protein